MDEFDARLAYVVGRRIRRIRRDQELSQEAVAWVAGMHATQMSLYEHGQRMPLLATFVKLAGGVGVTPCTLLDGIAWEADESHSGRFVFADHGRGLFVTPSEDEGDG
jgi:transcriptional regulator with XRE-family HTH domain